MMRFAKNERVSFPHDNPRHRTHLLAYLIIHGLFILYAPQFSYAAETYALMYDSNQAYGGVAPADSNSPYVPGAAVSVMPNTGLLVKTGYLFHGWNTRADGQGESYAPGGSFPMPAQNVILYARWKSGVMEYPATSPALNAPANNFAMQFDTGVIPSGFAAALEFTVTGNTSNDNRDFIYCDNYVLVALGNAYPIYGPLLPATVVYNVTSSVAGRNLSTENVFFSTNAWNTPNRDSFVYGSLTFSNIVLRLTPPFYTVAYYAGAHGVISGAATQTVSMGNDGTPVTVISDSGFQFHQWSDGRTDNPRQDTNVLGNISVTAQYMPTAEGEGEPPAEGEGEPHAEGEGEPHAGMQVLAVGDTYFVSHEGASVVFEVSVSGNHGVPEFQWYRATDDKALDIIHGAEQNIFIIANVVSDSAGEYQCEVRDEILSEVAWSPMFTLVVTSGIPASGLVAFLLAFVLTAFIGAALLGRRPTAS